MLCRCLNKILRTYVTRFDLEIHGAEIADRTIFVPGDVEGLHIHDDATALVQKESAKKRILDVEGWALQ